MPRENKNSETPKGILHHHIELVRFIGQLARVAQESEEKNQERVVQLEREAYEDPQTGLLNRRGFKKRAAEFIKNHPNPENLAILVIDLDRLKNLNDNAGHTFGDSAIAWTGKLLKENLRKSDLVAHYVSRRVGGDEFYTLVDLTPKEETDLTAEERLTAIQQRLKEGFHSDVLSRDGKFSLYNLDISMGAVMHKPNRDIAETIDKADALMYQHKRAAGNARR